MIYCSSCLQPDTRPNTKFNADGVCPACQYAALIDAIDWGARAQELKEIQDFGIAHRWGGYDCLIGISGGKDSTRQALFVKNALKLNPLLVCCSYPPQQVSQRGVSNLENLIAHGFNVIVVGPAPQTWKKNMRHGFFKYGNYMRSTELALYASVPRLAIAWQVPLIFWGENPALIVGDLGVQQSLGYDGNRLKWMNTLAGGDPLWLCVGDVKAKDILTYHYPTDEEMARAHLRIVYLGYFWKIWSKRDNGILSALNGLDIRDEKPGQIGDILGVDALDEDWVIINQMMKYRKYGFGKVTDIVNEEIRAGRMVRQEAIALVEKYDGKCSDQLVSDFCHYLEISEQEFWQVVDAHTNTDLFEKNGSQWKLKYEIGGGSYAR